MQISDLEHMIENNNITSKSAYRICKEIKKVEEERRKVKNDIELGRTFTSHLNKLLNEDNRKFLISELKKCENKLNQPYRNRVYTLFQEEYLLGKRDVFDERKTSVNEMGLQETSLQENTTR